MVNVSVRIGSIRCFSLRENQILKRSPHTFHHCWLISKLLGLWSAGSKKSIYIRTKPLLRQNVHTITHFCSHFLHKKTFISISIPVQVSLVESQYSLCESLLSTNITCSQWSHQITYYLWLSVWANNPPDIASLTHVAVWTIFCWME